MDKLKELKLLYVEDEYDTVVLYQQLFKERFLKVYCARDGNIALNFYDKYKPDVVILDINIPHISGLEIAKKIRTLDKEVKLILLTAQNDKDTLKQLIELNLVTYLEKPVSRGDLKEAFKKLEDSFPTDKFIDLWEIDNSFYKWDSLKKYLYKNDEAIKLTKKETLLLELFIKRKNEVLSYEDIYDSVWFEDNYKDFSIPSIKTLIKELRGKIPKNKIKSSYGRGYFLEL